MGAVDGYLVERLAVFVAPDGGGVVIVVLGWVFLVSLLGGVLETVVAEVVLEVAVEHCDRVSDKSIV